jgi:hypothetical protein
VKEQVTIVDQGLIEEAREGLRQTITLLQSIGMTNAMIASLFRAAADELDPKIIVPNHEHLH